MSRFYSIHILRIVCVNINKTCYTYVINLLSNFFEILNCIFLMLHLLDTFWKNVLIYFYIILNIIFDKDVLTGIINSIKYANI